MTRLNLFLNRHNTLLDWSAIVSLAIWIVVNLALLAWILTGHDL